MPKFLSAQKAGGLARFWPTLYLAWFQEFPQGMVEQTPGQPTPEEVQQHGKAVEKKQKVCHAFPCAHLALLMS
jgi:hypothetical protein